MNNTEYVMKYLLIKLKSLVVMLGCAGNIQCESGFRPDNLENSYEKKFRMSDKEYTKAVNDGTYREVRYDGDVKRLCTNHPNDSARTAFVNDYAGYGLIQSTFPDRKARLYDDVLRFCSENNKAFDIADIKAQAEHIYHELTEHYRKVYEPMTRASDVKEATTIFMQKFEVPWGYETEEVINQRYRTSVALWQSYFGGKVTFWFDFEGDWYYTENGYLVTSKWVQYENNWYYLDETGRMLTEKWLQYKQGWFYVNGGGTMLTNAWLKDNGNWYYLGDNGEMLKNCEKEIDGKKYSFSTDGIASEV